MDDKELDEDLDPDDDSDLKDFIVDDNEDIDKTLLDEASDPEEAVALSHGDTMYPDTPVPSRIVGSKRHAPFTPPLTTRSSGRNKPQNVDSVSPKARVNAPKNKHDDTVSGRPVASKRIFNVASLKTSPDKSKAIHLLDMLEKEMDDDSASNTLNVSKGDQPKEPDVGDNEKEVDLHGMGDGEAMPNVNTSKQKISKTSSKQKTDVTPVKKKSTAASQKKMSAAANVPKGSASFDLSSLGKKVDGEPSSVKPVKVAYKKDCLLVKELPSVCAFANSEDKSEVMKQNGLYDNLPNLSRIKILVSLKDVQPYGLPTIDGVYHSGVVNNFDVNRALNALTFIRSGRYVNIACCNPMDLVANPTWNSQHYEVCVGPRDSAICITPVMVANSYLNKLTKGAKFAVREIQARMFAEEFGCFASALGPEGGVLKSNEEEEFPSYLNEKTSPSKRASRKDKAKISENFKPMPLFIDLADLHFLVPVYDCRGDHAIQFNKETFDNLATQYKMYDGEVPNDSFVVVGHLVYVQKVQLNWKIFTYARWIMVLDGRNPPHASVADAVVAPANDNL
ncbi:hypothetical protein CPB84DRAFT_1849479 [Gymnopilus junonius]|uniref:Uncharacterized protein n=1 Tax=Gymnopilus junonius TaxID=109634 RepID=A0A9P5TKI7_GYMJU|nr:hypothetical protein CPB84DRAFT_1849479 [Gymnopilus junonius]